MIYIPSFIKIGAGIRKLIGGNAQTHREQGDLITHRITGVSDYIHRPDFNNYKKMNKHNVSETGSVSVLEDDG
jgi:hypothetical protein